MNDLTWNLQYYGDTLPLDAYNDITVDTKVSVEGRFETKSVILNQLNVDMELQAMTDEIVKYIEDRQYIRVNCYKDDKLWFFVIYSGIYDLEVDRDNYMISFSSLQHYMKDPD